MRRAELSWPTRLMYEASLGPYALRVLSFCFADRFTILTADQTAYILKLAGGVTSEQRKYFEDVLQSTRRAL